MKSILYIFKPLIYIVDTYNMPLVSKTNPRLVVNIAWKPLSLCLISFKGVTFENL